MVSDLNAVMSIIANVPAAVASTVCAAIISSPALDLTSRYRLSLAVLYGDWRSTRRKALNSWGTFIHEECLAQKLTGMISVEQHALPPLRSLAVRDLRLTVYCRIPKRK